MENLIKEYIARLNRLSEIVDVEEGDINAYMEIQSKLEKQIWEMAMLMDLAISSKIDEFEENNVDKTYPRTSKMFTKLKDRVLNKKEVNNEKN